VKTNGEIGSDMTTTTPENVEISTSREAKAQARKEAAQRVTDRKAWLRLRAISMGNLPSR
jgi:hypothetical protein